jgi:catechol 2,3-dioxygenase-like lactoylglutathione lyase family enzyme
MPLEIRRLILFTPNLPALTVFYQDVLGLDVINREKGWVEFDSGGCRLALHAGKSRIGDRPPKIVFYAADVAATRDSLIKRGLANAGTVKSTGVFDMCDCEDPDGNVFQISSRKS